MGIPATREWVDAKLAKTIRATNGDSGEKPPRTLQDLTDISLSTPANNEVLAYDETSGTWRNKKESGGTKVIANPSGTATDELNSIQIGNDIYSVPSGGGGGGGELRLNILKDGQISTLSSYAEAIFETKLDPLRDLVVIFDVVVDNTHYITKKTTEDCLNKSIGLNFYSGTLTVYVSDSSIKATHYSGDWKNIYVSIDTIIISSGGSSTHQYSEEEMIVGKWIDGRNVYERYCFESDIENLDFIVEQGMPYEENTELIYPPLTSDSNEHYEAFSSGTSGGYTWWAFNGRWDASEVCWYHNAVPSYVGIRFKDGPVKANMFKISQEVASPAYFKSYIFQGSNDKQNWDDLGTFTETEIAASKQYIHEVQLDKAYSYYRFYFTENGGGASGISVEEIQLYAHRKNVYRYVKSK